MPTKKIFALPIAVALGLLFSIQVLFAQTGDSQRLPCPTNPEEVAQFVGGNSTDWMTRTWVGGSWPFSATVPATLTVPQRGEHDQLDYWDNGAKSIIAGTISTTNASYSCVDYSQPEETPEVPEEPKQPEEPSAPNTNQRPACDKDCLPCPDSLEKVAELVSGGQGQWTAPDGEWGAWSFTATSPMTLTVPQRGLLDWLDYWASQPVSTSLGVIFVSEASYTCRPLIVETPEEPEEPEAPASPNTEQREACSQDCPPCPVTSQDVKNLVSNGEGKWQEPDGPWGSWKFTSETPVTLTVPLSGTIDFIDYWAGKPVSTSLGLVPNMTEASYTCQAPATVLVSIFMPQLAKAANAPQDEEEPPTDEVPSGPVVQSPWSCFASNEEAASKLGGQYWDWTPPKESEPWAAWTFHSVLPETVCHPGEMGGFLEHFSLGRLESGCFTAPIQDASYTCEDVED